MRLIPLLPTQFARHNFLSTIRQEQYIRHLGRYLVLDSGHLKMVNEIVNKTIKHHRHDDYIQHTDNPSTQHPL